MIPPALDTDTQYVYFTKNVIRLRHHLTAGHNWLTQQPITRQYCPDIVAFIILVGSTHPPDHCLDVCVSVLLQLLQVLVNPHVLHPVLHRGAEGDAWKGGMEGGGGMEEGGGAQQS